MYRYKLIKFKVGIL